MRTFTAVIEKCKDTGLLVGYILGLAGAHSQAESLDELQQNLQEVLQLVLSDGEPNGESEFMGTQSVSVAW
jgi:predicted RNase H-like HicB family nuclease